MSDVWTVQVTGQSYGPYPLDRMKEFIAEGRIVAKSLVAYGSDTQFHQAGHDLVLGQLLPPVEDEPAIHPEPVHEPSILAESSRQTISKETTPQTFNRAVDDGLAHIIIMTDLKSRSTNTIEDAIYELGPAFPILPQVWLVMTRHSVNGIRKLLSTRLGSVDALFVVDTTNDKAAWFNFAPEQEARIRRVWENETVPRTAA